MPLTCTDADGDQLTLSIVTGPAHGTLGAIAAGAVTYTPDAGYFGADSFTFKASDGTADSAPATASSPSPGLRPARSWRGACAPARASPSR